MIQLGEVSIERTPIFVGLLSKYYHDYPGGAMFRVDSLESLLHCFEILWEVYKWRECR